MPNSIFSQVQQEAFTPASRTNPWDRPSQRKTSTSAPVKLPEGSLLPSDPEVQKVIVETAEKYKLNPVYLLAMAHQESTYTADAVGPRTRWGTPKGMFQYLDSTAKNLGIDPLDYRQAAEAAGKTMAEQMAKGGPDWAFRYHHGGSNTKLHGKKTRRYAQEVMAKAQAIARELGIEISANADFSSVEDGTETAQKPTSIFEQVAQETAADVATPETPDSETSTGPESIGDTVRGRLAGAASESPMGVDPLTGGIAGPLKRTVERGWEGIKNALSRETEEVQVGEEELRREWDTSVSKSRIATEHGLTYDTWAKDNRTRTVSAKPFEQEEKEWAARLQSNPEDAYLLPKRLEHLRPKADDSNFAPSDTFQGVAQRFIANHKNPLDLMLQDSIPATLVTTLFTLPEVERKKFDKAREVTQALDIAAEPEDRTEEELEQANAVIGDWRRRTSDDVVEAWQEMYQAAKEDPSQFALGLSEAIIADAPLFATAPVVAIKPVRAIQAAQRISANTIAGRAGKIADRIISVGGTEAAINVGAGVLQNLATEGAINQSEVKLNAAMGVLLGGGLGLIFQKGAKAKAADLNKSKLEGTYEELIQDMAAADVEVEAIVRNQARNVTDLGTTGQRTELQTRLAELLGIKAFDNAKERQTWIKQRREEVRQTFKNESDFADYEKAKAEYRASRAARVGGDATRQQAEAAQAAEASAAGDAAKRQTLTEQFDAAVLARNEAEGSGTAEGLNRAASENERAMALADQLDAEEMYAAALSQDAGTLAQTEAKIKSRQDVFKGKFAKQEGKATPEDLARLGVVAGGAALGLAAFPEDQKLEGTILGGLAGLVIPAGGSVLSRMRQTGAISSDGLLIGLRTKGTKVANAVESADLRARDDAWIAEARAGNDAGFEGLYNTYRKRVVGTVRRYIERRELAVGDDPEGIAQEAFLKAFTKLKEDPDFKPENFEAFIVRVAQNTALDAVRKSESLRSGRDYEVTRAEDLRRFDEEGEELSARNIFDQAQDRPDYDTGLAGLNDTPENSAIRDDTLNVIREAFEKLPENRQKVMTLKHVQGMSEVDIAIELGMPLGSVSSAAKLGEDFVRAQIKKSATRLGTPISEVRGPKSQRGEVDPAVLKKLALTSVGAGTGLALGLRDDSPIWGLGVGAVAGLVLSGRVGKALVKGTDYALGISSTRVKNHSEPIHRAVVNMLRHELETVHNYFSETDPFVKAFNKLKKGEREILQRALSTGHSEIINKMLGILDSQSPGLKAAYGKVQGVIKIVGDQLENLSRIKRLKGREYFPRVVTDYDGLVKQLSKTPAGKETVGKIQTALREAEAKSIRTNSRPLNEVEKSDLINQILFTEKKSIQPEWSKARVIEEITPELLPFYATPAEALHTYLRSAVQDIERSKFFGKYARASKGRKKSKGLEFLDVERSINNLIHDQVMSGKLTNEGAYEVSNILKSLFADKSPNAFIGNFKNLSYAGLLGNIGSAVVQTGDVIIQGFTQDIRSTLEALVRQATGKKFVNMREFGLADSITAEFANQAKSSKLLSKYLAISLFAGVDRFGKNTALNAAVIRARRLAESESGQARLANRYADAFGDDFPKLVSELKSGKITELTKEYAFLELSRSQPVTKLEMSQMWLDSPNAGRAALMLKSFMLKQADLARREGYNQIKKGNVARGLYDLTRLSIFLGLAGTSSETLKHFLWEGVDALVTGDPVEEKDLDPMDIPLNAFRTFGMTEYVKNRFLGVSKEEAKERRREGEKGARFIKAEPAKAAVEYFTPPFRVWTDIATGNPNMYRYFIPVFGPYIAEKMREVDAEQRKLEDKGSRRSERSNR